MYKYNYNPQSEKDFYYNANFITQHNNIDDDNYCDYYQNTALLLAVEIDKKNIKDFKNYIKNKVTMTSEEAWSYIHNKIRTIRGD